MLDHLVFATPDLPDTVVRFTRLTGVRPVAGGRHVGHGTANYLVGLGRDAYLEIVGPDPQQPDADPGEFGPDQLAAARMLTWAIHPRDFDDRIAVARAGGYDPGPILPMSRAAPDGVVLSWRLTWRDELDCGGLVPFLIDWGATPHPANRPLPVVPLLSLDGIHPRPHQVRATLEVLGVKLCIHPGSATSLVATLQGRHGPVLLN